MDIVNLPAIIPSKTEIALGSFDMGANPEWDVNDSYGELGQKDANTFGRWLSNARSVENNFLEVVFYCLRQFRNRNYAPLTGLIALTSGKEWRGLKLAAGNTGVTGFKAPLSAILSQVLVDAKLTFKDGKAKWVVGHNGGMDERAMQALYELKQAGVTCRGKRFKDAFPAKKSAKEAEKSAVESVIEDLLKRPHDSLSEAEQALVKAAHDKMVEDMKAQAKRLRKIMEEKGWNESDFIAILQHAE